MGKYKEKLQRMKRFSDALNNTRVSMVLYGLVEGHNYTTKIAKELGKSPTNVSKGIRKLRELEIISYDGKKGRKQLYKVNWGRLFEIAFYWSLREGLPEEEIKQAREKVWQGKDYFTGRLRKWYFEELVEGLNETTEDLGEKSKAEVYSSTHTTILSEMMSFLKFEVLGAYDIVKDMKEEGKDVKEGAFSALKAWNSSLREDLRTKADLRDLRSHFLEEDKKS